MPLRSAPRRRAGQRSELRSRLLFLLPGQPALLLGGEPEVLLDGQLLVAGGALGPEHGALTRSLRLPPVLSPVHAAVLEPALGRRIRPALRPQSAAGPGQIDPSYSDVFSFQSGYQPTWRVQWDLADAGTTLASPISATQTTITVTTNIWIPAPTFYVYIGSEILQVTASRRH